MIFFKFVYINLPQIFDLLEQFLKNNVSSTFIYMLVWSRLVNGFPSRLATYNSIAMVKWFDSCFGFKSQLSPSGFVLMVPPRKIVWCSAIEGNVPFFLCFDFCGQSVSVCSLSNASLSEQKILQSSHIWRKSLSGLHSLKSTRFCWKLVFRRKFLLLSGWSNGQMPNA